MEPLPVWFHGHLGSNAEAMVQCAKVLMGER